MALVLDNTDAFVDAMAADFGTRSRAATVVHRVDRHGLGHRAHEIACRVKTRSGGVGRNDFAAQMIPSALPFGAPLRLGANAMMRLTRARTRRRLRRG